MADKSLNVKLTATYGEFQTAFTKAREIMNGAVGGMRDELKMASEQARVETRKYESTIEQFARVVKNDFKGLNGAISGVKIAWAQLGAVLGVGLAIKSAIDETAQFGVESQKLARSLGITTQAASGLNLAIGDVHGSTEEYLTAAKGLDKHLRTNEQSLNDMGLATRDASGQLRNQQELMMDALSVLRGYKEGTDRNLAAQALFGKGIEVSSEMLALNTQGVSDATEKAERLRLTWGVDSVAALSAYRGALNDADDALTGMKVTIATQVMPILTSMMNFLSQHGESVIHALASALTVASSAMVVFGARALYAATTALPAVVAAMAAVAEGAGFVTIALTGLSAIAAVLFSPAGLMVAATAFVYALATKQTEAEKAANAHKKALEELNKVMGISKDDAVDLSDKLREETAERLRLAQATLIQAQAQAAAVQNLTSKGGVELLGAANAQLQSQLDLVAELQREMGNLAVAKMKAMGGDARTNGRGPDSGKSFEDPAIAEAAAKEAAAKAKAEATKAAAEQKQIAQAAYQAKMELLKGEEDAVRGTYAKEIEIQRAELAATVAMYGQGSKEAVAAQNKISATLREQAAEASRIIDIKKAHDADYAAYQVDIDEQSADAAYAMGQISDEKRLQLQMQFEDRRFEIDLAALKDRLGTMNAETEEYAAMYGRIEKLKQEHDLHMKGLALKAKATEMAPFKSMMTAMRQGWAQNAAAVLTGQMTLRKGFVAIYKGMLASFTDYLAKKLAASKLFAALEITVGKMIAGVLRLLGIQSATESIGIKMGETDAKIGASAVVAGAGAAESQASIPYIGPILAIAAMAAIFAAVMGMKSKGGGGSIPSAAGGFDIPAGMNPITQLHQNEMVLPAAQADVIRDMAAGGGAGKAVHLHVHAADADSVKRLFLNNKRALADAIRAAARDGMGFA